MSESILPFEGLRVCDFSWFAAGPVATKFLGDHGAEVIKMESGTHPDGIRIASPLTPGKEDDSLNVGGWFNNQNTSKLCLGLNFSLPGAKDVYDRLIMASDIVVENFSPLMKDRLGLNYEDYAKKKPDLIWVDQPMQGLTGPHRNRAGFGQTITPSGGLSYVSGYQHRSPIGTGTNYTDYVVNSGQMAFALLGALIQRKKTGKGRHIIMAQIASATTILQTAILDYTVNGRIQERNGNRSDNAAPHGCYRCRGEDRDCVYVTSMGPAPGKKNERWCVITVYTDEQWQTLCRVMDKTELASDVRFSTYLARKENEDALNAAIQEWTIERSPEEVMMLLQREGVPAGVVQDGEDVLLHDPQLRSRAYYVYLDHSETGLSAYDSFACKLSATPGRLSTPAPRIGEHSEYVCREVLGMSEEEYTQLLVDAVVEIG